MSKTKKEIEDCIQRLLVCDKPKMVAAVFHDSTELSEEQCKHFATAEYLWQVKPIEKEGPHQGMHVGLLLDENLNYVHLVIATEKMMREIAGFWYVTS